MRALDVEREDKGQPEVLEQAFRDVIAYPERKLSQLGHARVEFEEIVASFKRNDMDDMRSRLMDLGNILGVDIWIPSR